MDLWQFVLVSLGGSAALLAVLGWLAKSLLVQLLARDMSRYELELKSQTDLAIERFKLEQQLLATEHNVRFSRLHEKRAELIADFYKAIVAFERYFKTHAHPINQNITSDVGGKHSQAIKALFEDIEQIYSNNRIVFSGETCRLVDALLDALVGVRDLNVSVPIRSLEDGSPKEAIRIPSWNGISDRISPVKANLEENFRSLLGVQG